jgi:hypothetical protein
MERLTEGTHNPNAAALRRKISTKRANVKGYLPQSFNQWVRKLNYFCGSLG